MPSAAGTIRPARLAARPPSAAARGHARLDAYGEGEAPERRPANNKWQLLYKGSISDDDLREL